MLKQINRVLKLVGLNLVRAKRKNRTKPNPNYRPVPANQAGTPYDASKYTGDAEWQSNAPSKVSCAVLSNPGGLLVGHHNTRIGLKAKVQVVDLDAAFVPVDIDERPRVEQPHSDNKTSGPTS